MSGPVSRRGVCFIFAAPSGAGKSTICRALLEKETDLSLSISVTTRPPRSREQEGVHYYYRSNAEFERLAKAGELLEWACVFGRLYGTPRSAVEAHLSAGRDVLFDIDWQGWRQMRAALPADTVGVFILPPSLDTLVDRLRRRAEDHPGEIARRMALAKDEIAHWAEFDHVLVNDDLATCLAEARAVIQAARSLTSRRIGLAAFVSRLTSPA